MHSNRQIILILFTFLSLLFTSATAFSHGVIESPKSREQFCGVESKPEEIYKDKMTHEQCRPVMTKEDGMLDNSIYSFMAVLTHTIGRSIKPINQLPKYVCGFASETWSGGKTPWDRAIDWPTILIKSGKQEFIWNISWGNHFSDTEEFVYWITKSDFQFDPKKELTWNDFEEEPFCHLKYDDTDPEGNPNIKPDKVNSKFTTYCVVPVRTNRAVIYAEWGRNKSTYERFHSCIDAVFSSQPSPSISAVISSLPSQITGPTNLTLDASKSVGANLTYTWSIDADNLTPYILENPHGLKTNLMIANVNAQQSVTINLTVQQGQTTNLASVRLTHNPATMTGSWKTVGRATLALTLKVGDKIQLRLIDDKGKDYFLPATPLVLTAETAKSTVWAYTLAQLVNPNNVFSAKIGVLQSDNKTILPVKSATNNMIYVPEISPVVNGYIHVNESTEACTAKQRPGASAYWLGYDLYVANTPVVLDFKPTGIDLTKVNIDKGAFDKIQIRDKDTLVIGAKSDWVNKTSPGYIGFMPKSGSYNPLGSTYVAQCHSER